MRRGDVNLMESIRVLETQKYLMLIMEGAVFMHVSICIGVLRLALLLFEPSAYHKRMKKCSGNQMTRCVTSPASV